MDDTERSRGRIIGLVDSPISRANVGGDVGLLDGEFCGAGGADEKEFSLSRRATAEYLVPLAIVFRRSRNRELAISGPTD